MDNREIRNENATADTMAGTDLKTILSNGRAVN